MSRFRIAFVIAALGFLQGCMQVPVSGSQPAATASDQPRSFLYSWAMYGDPVFDRDVQTFSQSYARAFGGPADQALFGNTSSRLAKADPTAMQEAFTGLAAQAVDGEDLVVVMLTSHGRPGTIAVYEGGNGPLFALTGAQLDEYLEPLENDRTLLIVQACFSGSLIRDLQHPNRIILTAASADRSSFGCSPDSDNTWFIKSLNRAMAQGGSWQQIFATTRALVLADEAAAGFPASNPQAWVGANMRDFWRGGAL